MFVLAAAAIGLPVTTSSTLSGTGSTPRSRSGCFSEVPHPTSERQGGSLPVARDVVRWQPVAGSGQGNGARINST